MYLASSFIIFGDLESLGVFNDTECHACSAALFLPFLMQTSIFASTLFPRIEP